MCMSLPSGRTGRECHLAVEQVNKADRNNSYSIKKKIVQHTFLFVLSGEIANGQLLGVLGALLEQNRQHPKNRGTDAGLAGGYIARVKWN